MRRLKRGYHTRKRVVAFLEAGRDSDITAQRPRKHQDENLAGLGLKSGRPLNAF